jgi:hypothetical protein
VSQAVIDALWPGYSGERLDAEIEFTGRFIPFLDYETGTEVGGSASNRGVQASLPAVEWPESPAVVDDVSTVETEVSASTDSDSASSESKDVGVRASNAASASSVERLDVAEAESKETPSTEAEVSTSTEASNSDAQSSGSSRACVVSALATLMLFLLC